jgi:uncharacterized membrane protein YhiD involved in acid resistance
MPDWLTLPQAGDVPTTSVDLAVRLIVAAAFGVLVAAVYRLSHGREKQDRSTFMTTLVLLSVLIAMVSMVIGNSVARAFSLVGALSIVRFRTVVDDTRDTAYVIFAVIVGMAAGAGLYWVAGVGIPVVALVSLGMSYLALGACRPTQSYMLIVRLALGRDPDALLADVLDRHAVDEELTAVATARQGTTLEVTYTVRMEPQASMTKFVAEVNALEGVTGVELKSIAN